MKGINLTAFLLVVCSLVSCSNDVISNDVVLNTLDNSQSQQTKNKIDSQLGENQKMNHIITAEKREVKTLEKGFVPFPSDIFVAEQPYLKDNFFPLLSIDLGELNDDFKGTVVHMINPLEPFEQYIGSYTKDYYTDFVGENWIAFQLTEDNKYKFLGKEEYFLTSSIHKELLNLDSYNAEHIKEMRDSYPERKAYFQKHGKLFSYSEDEDTSYLDQLGGEVWEGNWTGHPPPPPAFQLTYTDTEKNGIEDISITYKGERFYYIADVAGYNWMAQGADSILMFYEPNSRIVLFTFDWT